MVIKFKYKNQYKCQDYIIEKYNSFWYGDINKMDIQKFFIKLINDEDYLLCVIGPSNYMTVYLYKEHEYIKYDILFEKLLRKRKIKNLLKN